MGENVQVGNDDIESNGRRFHETLCHVPIPQTGEEDATNIKHDWANCPMNINRDKSTLELKLTGCILRCLSIHKFLNPQSYSGSSTHTFPA